MPNPFVHVELNTTDVGKSKTFYGELFDWKLEDVPIGDIAYTMIGVGSETAGGMLKNPMPGAAKIIRDVSEVGDLGWLSIIMEPTGAGLGLWQAKPRA
jgi:uncharacterized protein